MLAKRGWPRSKIKTCGFGSRHDSAEKASASATGAPQTREQALHAFLEKGQSYLRRSPALQKTLRWQVRRRGLQKWVAVRSAKWSILSN